jgi:hypothetical protein
VPSARQFAKPSTVLIALETEELLAARYHKFRAIGQWREE